MDQLKAILGRLTMAQKITTAVVIVAALSGLYGLVHWRKESDFKPLYTGLAAEDSAAVVQKLKESGAEYRLSDSGDTIAVPSARLAELRLEMASAGLPKTGRIGFEIFDKTTLGTTDFVEHVNYRRALEGELERSVAAITAVEQARVHVSFPKDSVFTESREPAKASVLVKLRPGTRLSARNVTAISHLVGAAVEGLSPDAVSVLDMQGNLLSRPHPASPEEAASDAALDYRQKIERDLLQKINMTLEPLLGHDRYRASVSVDCDLTSGEQSEETLDPSRSVMLQSQKTEDVSNNGQLAGGVPGTQSNLPRPTGRSGGSNSTTRRTENVTYQSSRITRTTKMPQGQLKRISVALLLDHSLTWQGSGRNLHKVITPPSPETLKAVREVVAAAVGMVETRGDQLTVDSLPFEQTLNLTAPESQILTPVVPVTPAPWWMSYKDKKMLLPAAAGAALVLLVVVAALILKLRRREKPAGASVSVEEHKVLAPGSQAAAIEAANLAEQIEAKMAERQAEQEKADMLALASIKLPPVRTKKAEVLAKQLKENVKKDATAPANVLQGWIHDRS